MPVTHNPNMPQQPSEPAAVYPPQESQSQKSLIEQRLEGVSLQTSGGAAQQIDIPKSDVEKAVEEIRIMASPEESAVGREYLSQSAEEIARSIDAGDDSEVMQHYLTPDLPELCYEYLNAQKSQDAARIQAAWADVEAAQVRIDAFANWMQSHGEPLLKEIHRLTDVQVDQLKQIQEMDAVNRALDAQLASVSQIKQQVIGVDEGQLRELQTRNRLVEGMLEKAEGAAQQHEEMAQQLQASAQEVRRLAAKLDETQDLLIEAHREIKELKNPIQDDCYIDSSGLRPVASAALGDSTEPPMGYVEMSHLNQRLADVWQEQDAHQRRTQNLEHEQEGVQRTFKWLLPALAATAAVALLGALQAL